MKKRNIIEIKGYCDDDDSGGGDDDDAKDRKVVKIIEKGIDYGTHGNIWATSIILSRYLSSKEGRKRVKGKSVLELGSGTGLGGLASVIFADAKSAVLSDLPCAMEDLKTNVKLNENTNVSTLSLTMGDEDNESHKKALDMEPNIILCSDVMYNSKMIKLVCRSLQRIATLHTSIWIAFIDRTVKGDPEPLEELSNFGFFCIQAVDLMTLSCCNSICSETEDFDYLEDVNIWLWELRKKN